MHTSPVRHTSVHALNKEAAFLLLLFKDENVFIHPSPEAMSSSQSLSSVQCVHVHVPLRVLWSETELNEHVHKEWLGLPQTTEGLRHLHNPMRRSSSVPSCHHLRFQALKLRKSPTQAEPAVFLFCSESRSDDVLALTRSTH